MAVGVCASITVTSNWQVAVLDEISVAVNKMVLVPNGNKSPENNPEVWVTTTPVQLSVADGLVKTTFVPHSSTSLPTVILDGQLVKIGAVISNTSIVNVVVDVQVERVAVTVTV